MFSAIGSPSLCENAMYGIVRAGPSTASTGKIPFVLSEREEVVPSRAVTAAEVERNVCRFSTNIINIPEDCDSSTVCQCVVPTCPADTFSVDCQRG
jgi:hypothetical protein